MKESSILFNADMVRAVLRGDKTQTRRVIKHQPLEVVPFLDSSGSPTYEYGLCLEFPRVISKHVCCPFGQPGDRLWVKETWQEFFEDELPLCRPRGPRGRMGIPARPDRRSFVVYRADGEMPDHPQYGKALWRPSIHMPRWASRLTLEITAVRVERLQDITEADAIAEGVELVDHVDGEPVYRDYFADDYTWSAVRSYRTLWWRLYGFKGPDAWDKNPWVWTVEFKRVEKASC